MKVECRRVGDRELSRYLGKLYSMQIAGSEGRRGLREVGESDLQQLRLTLEAAGASAH